jgi:hypothetical protein
MRYRVIAAAGIIAAIGLAAVLAAPWYSGLVHLFGREVELEVNAWQAFDWEDVAVVGLAAVAAVALLVSQSVVASGALVGLGASIIALGLIVYRVLERPHETGAREATTDWGAYAALGAAAVLVLASMLAYIEERKAPTTAAIP